MYNSSCKLRKGEKPTSREKNSHVLEQRPPHAAVFLPRWRNLLPFHCQLASSVRSTFTPPMLPLVHWRDDFTARGREHGNHANLDEVDTRRNGGTRFLPTPVFIKSRTEEEEEEDSCWEVCRTCITNSSCGLQEETCQQNTGCVFNRL